MSKSDNTTIKISKNSRKEIMKIGKMGESFADVIDKLIESYKKNINR